MSVCCLCGKVFGSFGFSFRTDGQLVCAPACRSSMADAGASNVVGHTGRMDNDGGSSSNNNYIPASAPMCDSPCLTRLDDMQVTSACMRVHETAGAASAPLKRSAEFAGFNAASSATSPAIMPPPARKVAMDMAPIPCSLHPSASVTPPAVPMGHCQCRGSAQQDNITATAGCRPVSVPLTPAAGAHNQQFAGTWGLGTIEHNRARSAANLMPPPPMPPLGAVTTGFHASACTLSATAATPRLATSSSHEQTPPGQWQTPAGQQGRVGFISPFTTPATGVPPSTNGRTPSLAEVLGEDWGDDCLNDDSWTSYDPRTAAKHHVDPCPTTPQDASKAQQAAGIHTSSSSPAPQAQHSPAAAGQQTSPSQVLATLSLRSPQAAHPSSPIQHGQPPAHGFGGPPVLQLQQQQQQQQQPYSWSGGSAGYGWQHTTSSPHHVARRLDVDGSGVQQQQGPWSPDACSLQQQQQQQQYQHQQPRARPQVQQQQQAQQQQQPWTTHPPSHTSTLATSSSSLTALAHSPSWVHTRFWSLRFWDQLMGCWDAVRLMGDGRVSAGERAELVARRLNHPGQQLMDLAMSKGSPFLALVFPLRLMVEYLGVMHWVSAEALARLPHTPPDKVDALLKADFGQAQAAAATFGLQQLVSGPGWPMLPSSATQLMIDADWLQWNAERGCYSYDYQPKQYDVDADGRVQLSQFIHISMAISSDDNQLSTQIEFTALQQSKSTHLTRHPLINSHNKVLCASIPSDFKAESELRNRMAAGVVLAGRLYKCLAFKENKVYFIATATAAAGDQLDAEGFPAACTAPGSMPKLTPGTFVGLEPAQARDVLAAVRTIPCKPSSGKLHARMELLLSQTVPIPHVLSANIRYTDDLYGSGLGDDGKPACMTDGAGLMGLGVARRCPIVNQGELSSKALESAQDTLPVAQVRVVDPRAPMPLLSKGLLVPCSVLPDEMVLLPFSMLKAPADPKAYIGSLLVEDPVMTQQLGRPVYNVDSSVQQEYWERSSCCSPSGRPGAAHLWAHESICQAWEASGRSWEEEARVAHVGVVNSNFGRMGGNTDRSLLLLLDYGGVPRDIFKRQMQAQLEQFTGLQDNPERALRIASSMGCESLEELMLAGVGFQADSKGRLVFTPDLHMLMALYNLEQQRTQDLRRMRMRLEGAFRLVGAPDFSGSVPEGCVVVATDAPFAQEQEVLLYRSPGTHPQDIRRARVIPPPPGLLSFHQATQGKLCLKFTIIFSTLGAKSLAHWMATGDFDGDLYMVITNKDMVASYHVYEEPCTAAPAAAQLPQAPAPAVKLEARALTPQQPRLVAATLQAAAAMQLPSDLGQGVRPKQEACGGTQAARPLDALQLLFSMPQVAEKELQAFFFQCSKIEREMGKASNTWLKWADLNGPGCAECLELTDLYEQLLDAKKKGCSVTVPKRLDIRRTPKWMTLDTEEGDTRQLLGGGAAGAAGCAGLGGLEQVGEEVSAGQLSIISELFELIKEPRMPDQFAQPLLELDPDLLCEEPQGASPAVRERQWQQLFEMWREEWSGFLKGFHTGASRKAQRRAQERMRAKSVDLSLRMRRVLFCNGSQCDDMRLEYYRNASALYRIVYRFAQQRADAGEVPRLNSVWSVAGDVLAELKSMRLHEKQSKADPTKRRPIQANRDILALVRRGARAAREQTDMERECMEAFTQP